MTHVQQQLSIEETQHVLRLLAAHAVELRIGHQGGILCRDPEGWLKEADREFLRSHRDEFVEQLLNQREPIDEPFVIDAPRCDRCKSLEFKDVPIHGGQSKRRDCRRCGRTVGFRKWHGVNDAALPPLPRKPR